MTPILQEFEKEAKRLGIKDVRSLVLENLSDKDQLTVLNQIGKKEAALVGIINHPKLFEIEEVYQLTLKLLGIMEVSENKEELINYSRRERNPKKSSPLILIKS